MKYLVAPNKLHHLFLLQWMAAFPSAFTYAAPGSNTSQPDIAFSYRLGPQPESAWASDIKQTILRGGPLPSREVVFFHSASRTLILTDLIENFRPELLNWRQRCLARFGGVLFPNGQTPLDWRLTFIFGKKKARASLQTILEWKPERVIISHGVCALADGEIFVRQAFSWV